MIAFRCARCDYTYDIPVSPDSVMVLSRKTEGHLKTTRYYGARGSSGYLRVYDKRVEEKSRLKDDFIGHDLTRLEWEQRNDAEFRFDRFAVPDFSDLRGYAAFLKYVDPAFRNIPLHLRYSSTYGNCISENMACLTRSKQTGQSTANFNLI